MPLPGAHPVLRDPVFSGTSGAMRLVDRLSRTSLSLGLVCAGLALFSALWLGGADERWLDQIPKRKAQGKELRLEHHMALGFRRAAWAGLAVGLSGAAAIAWVAWRKGAPGSATAAVGAVSEIGEAGSPAGLWPDGWPHPVPWRTVVAVGALAMVVSGALRWPRLGHSFWSDEAYAARAYVWGVNVAQADGTLVYKPVAWREALFLNERANNQVWCSIEARLAHSVWQRATGAPPGTFSERAMRMPAFVWGLLTVGAATMLGGMLAGRGGTAVGLLLAVHPWHVRFAAEMRGYSAMLLALTLGVIFLLLALRDGRWRWWLLNAASNLWALLAFAGSAHVPLVCCGAAAGWLAWRRRGAWLGRLVLANGLAAVAFLWLYGPSITQLSEFLRQGTDAAAYTVGLDWLRQFGESLCLGVPWSVMSETWQQATWLPSAKAAALAVSVVALLAAMRTLTALRFEPRLLLVSALLTAAGALSIAQSLVAGTLLLMWYLLPVLIGWVVLLGTCPRPAGSASGDTRRALLAGAHVVTIAVCLVVWSGPSLAMARVPRQPMREAARAVNLSAALSPVADATGGARLGAVVGISDGQMKLYAPGTITVKSLADLEMAEARAAADGKKLWMIVGGWEATRERSPEIIARLTGGMYEKEADLPGWEPMFSYQVWRHR
jgi:hypothetical protein